MKHIRVSGQYQPCTNLNFFLLRLCWHWHSRVVGGHASLCQERPGVITGVRPCTWFGVTTWFGVITWLGVITWPGVITGVRPCTWLWPGGLETNLATWRFFLFHTYRLFPHFRLDIVIHRVIIKDCCFIFTGRSPTMSRCHMVMRSLSALAAVSFTISQSLLYLVLFTIARGDGENC